MRSCFSFSVLNPSPFLARRWRHGFAAALAALSSYAGAEPAVTSAAEKVIVDNFAAWTAQAKGCENIHNYQSPYANRGTVEAVLTCQALKLGGYGGAFVLVPVPNYTRAKVMATAGEVTMPTETLWLEDVDERVFYSPKPLIADGEFVKGVYVKASNSKKVAVSNLNDLRKYKAVMPKLWWKDWAALQDMKIDTMDAATKESIFNMVEAERADFTLLEFSAENSMAQNLGKISLLPVPGVKIILHGERRLAISKSAPNGLAAFNAISKGVDQLRANGTIARAWRESGFISKQTERWSALN